MDGGRGLKGGGRADELEAETAGGADDEDGGLGHDEKARLFEYGRLGDLSGTFECVEFADRG